MSDPVVYLFCDTNLLFQCKPLEELDWSEWKSREVRVVVTIPVLREVDYRKSHGNARVSRRARAASALFRKMLPAGEKIVREAGPRVSLYVASQHQYSQELEGTLNYQERDDQLVGIVHRFAAENPEEDARLLTHDTGPSYTAAGLGLNIEMIPEGWLLAPENDEQQKRINKLETELSNYRRAEPYFEVLLLDAENNEAVRFEGRVRWYDALTENEVSELVERLRRRIPIPTESRESSGDVHSVLASIGHAAGREMAKYRNELSQWLDECTEILRHLHRLLQREQAAPMYTFLVENLGTRPAVDALVTIEGCGSVQTMPPRDGDQGDSIRLPSPPKPLDLGLHNLFGEAGYSAYRNPIPDVEFDGPPLRRDHNKFYYRDTPSVPQASFSLTCDQWRHADGQEEFCGEIHLTDADGKGALVLRIQAENLWKPFERTFAVRISTERVSSYPAAVELLEQAEAGEER